MVDQSQIRNFIAAGANYNTEFYAMSREICYLLHHARLWYIRVHIETNVYISRLK
jgi:hypothetical protein